MFERKQVGLFYVFKGSILFTFGFPHASVGWGEREREGGKGIIFVLFVIK